MSKEEKKTNLSGKKRPSSSSSSSSDSFITNKKQKKEEKIDTAFSDYYTNVVDKQKAKELFTQLKTKVEAITQEFGRTKIKVFGKEHHQPRLMAYFSREPNEVFFFFFLTCFSFFLHFISVLRITPTPKRKFKPMVGPLKLSFLLLSLTNKQTKRSIPVWSTCTVMVTIKWGSTVMTTLWILLSLLFHLAQLVILSYETTRTSAYALSLFKTTACLS
jgi:hypothetical protein